SFAGLLPICLSTFFSSALSSSSLFTSHILIAPISALDNAIDIHYHYFRYPLFLTGAGNAHV
ncbi:hypothetical protein, partial [Vibrio parahaemolyticus]|uniref:hypothetical protein n=1 Tax=Vibrio parahaemolyticus TaxID=670 RepID=UPI001E386365